MKKSLLPLALVFLIASLGWNLYRALERATAPVSTYIVEINIPPMEAGESSSTYFRAGPGYEYRQTGHYDTEGIALARSYDNNWILVALGVDVGGDREVFAQSWVPAQFVAVNVANLLYTNTTQLEDPFLQVNCSTSQNGDNPETINVGYHVGEGHNVTFSLHPVQVWNGFDGGIYEFDTEQVMAYGLQVKLNGIVYRDLYYDPTNPSVFFDSCEYRPAN